MTTMLHTCPLTSSKFFGCYVARNLPADVKSRRLPLALVLNCNVPGTGRHWAAIWVVNPTTVVYFCPMGRPPSREARQWMRQFRNFSRNHVSLQRRESTACGAYVMYAIYHFCRGQTLRQIVSKLREQRGREDDFVTNFIQKVSACAGKYM